MRKDELLKQLWAVSDELAEKGWSQSLQDEKNKLTKLLGELDGQDANGATTESKGGT